MNRTQPGWQQLMEIPFAGWIIGIAGLAILLMVAFYVIGKVRNMALGAEDEPMNYLSEFRQLKTEGKLSEEEFQRVRELTPLPELEVIGKSDSPRRMHSQSVLPSQTPDFTPLDDQSPEESDRDHKT